MELGTWFSIDEVMIKGGIKGYDTNPPYDGNGCYKGLNKLTNMT